MEITIWADRGKYWQNSDDTHTRTWPHVDRNGRADVEIDMAAAGKRDNHHALLVLARSFPMTDSHLSPFSHQVECHVLCYQTMVASLPDR